MKIETNVLRPEPENPDFSKENLEKECIEAVVDVLELPNKTNVRVTQDGVFLYYVGKVFKFDVDVRLVQEVLNPDVFIFGIK